MKKLANLEKVIAKLNAPTVWEDGEVVDSQFDFTYECKVHEYHNVPIIEIYDRNEAYHAYYLEDLNSELYYAAQEFGFKYEPIREDEIHDELNAAVKEDLGNDHYLEWENNVVLSVVL